MKSQTSFREFLRIFDIVRLSRLALGLALAFSLSIAWPVTPAHAASLTVNTLEDNNIDGDGLCTLREAIYAANFDANFHDCIGVGVFGTDTITFSLSGTIVLGSTLPVIADAEGLTVDGSGHKLAISGNDSVRVLNVVSNSLLTLHNLVVTRGYETSGLGGGITNSGTMTITNSTISNNSSPHGGGGIRNYEGATLTISNTTICTNTVAATSGSHGGGGIFTTGTLILNNSTISGNTVSTSGGSPSAAYGGGIYLGGGTLTLNNTSITNNSASGSGGSSGYGGGIYAGENTTFRNTIIAGNRATYFADCYGTLNSQGYNLIQIPSCNITGDLTTNITGLSPNLAPLADNGGPTKTHALLSGSPAIDAGNPATPGSGGNACLLTDQTGFIRPVDGDMDGDAICDMGAYELPHRHFLPIVRKD